MKYKYMLISAGIVAWVVAGADLATNVYVNHQKVLALQNTKQQTQMVNKQETALEQQLQTAQSQVVADDTKLTATTKEACSDLVQVQTLLARNKLSVPVSIPSFCE